MINLYEWFYLAESRSSKIITYAFYLIIITSILCINVMGPYKSLLFIGVIGLVLVDIRNNSAQRKPKITALFWSYQHGWSVLTGDGNEFIPIFIQKKIVFTFVTLLSFSDLYGGNYQIYLFSDTMSENNWKKFQVILRNHKDNSVQLW